MNESFGGQKYLVNCQRARITKRAPGRRTYVKVCTGACPKYLPYFGEIRVYYRPPALHHTVREATRASRKPSTVLQTPSPKSLRLIPEPKSDDLLHPAAVLSRASAKIFYQ